MSQANVEIVRRVVRRIQRTGNPSVQGCFYPDVGPGHLHMVFVLLPLFRGHDGFREWLATQRGHVGQPTAGTGGV